MKNSNVNIIDQLHTLGDFLRWTVSEFEQVPVYYGHGTDNAWDEAIYLLLGALHLPLDFPSALFSSQLLKNEKELIVKLVQQRTEERIPVAYLLHQAWFCGLRFYVDERVLIPRSPMAELITKQFEPWLPIDQPVTHILEIGTGSGCIACACAMAFPNAQVDAVDISQEALTVAKKNVENLDLTERVHLIHADVFPLNKKRYDLIISNPPYVDAAEMAALPPEYLHEPRMALASGQDGLDCVRTILQQAKSYLHPQGLLMVEVGVSAAALQEAFPDLPFTWIELEQGGEGIFMLHAEELA